MRASAATCDPPSPSTAWTRPRIFSQSTWRTRVDMSSSSDRVEHRTDEENRETSRQKSQYMHFVTSSTISSDSRFDPLHHKIAARTPSCLWAEIIEIASSRPIIRTSSLSASHVSAGQWGAHQSKRHRTVSPLPPFPSVARGFLSFGVGLPCHFHSFSAAIHHRWPCGGGCCCCWPCWLAACCCCARKSCWASMLICSGVALPCRACSCCCNAISGAAFCI